MTGPQEWPVGQFAEVDWLSSEQPELGTLAVYCSLGMRRYWRAINGYEIQTAQVTAVRPLRLVPADAIMVEKTSMISNLCHWQQGRGDARKQSHWDFHFGSPCPYRIVALILQGEPDPRDGMPPDPEVRYEYCDNGLHSIPAGWPCESCRLATARGDQSPVPVPRDGLERLKPWTREEVDRFRADLFAVLADVAEGSGSFPGFANRLREHVDFFEEDPATAHDTANGPPAAEPLTLARVFRALADVHAQAGSKSPVRMFTDAAEAAEQGTPGAVPVAAPATETHDSRITNHEPTCDHDSSSPHPVFGRTNSWCTGPGIAAEPSVGTGTPAEAVSTGVDRLWSHRDPACVAAWPECWPGEYNPKCCRFPKSCSVDFLDDDVPAEEVSGGSGHAERQEPAGWRLDPSNTVASWYLITPSGAHGGWLYESSRAEFEVLTASAAEVARLGDDRDEAAAQLQRAEEQLALAERHAEQARVDAGLNAGQRDLALAEVARYRAAIEEADHRLDIAVAHAGSGFKKPTQELVERVAELVRAPLAAALGDGE